MARKFKYVGPFDAVALYGHGVVERGGEVTATDAAQADEFNSRDDFEAVPTKKEG